MEQYLLNDKILSDPEKNQKSIFHKLQTYDQQISFQHFHISLSCMKIIVGLQKLRFKDQRK